MTLSIVIPYFNTPISYLFDLLSSIRMQLAVDFKKIEVIIVNDAGKPVPEFMLELFTPLNIRQITLKRNYGPGIARQAGIDEAKGDYVMFCDADDVLHNVGAVSTLIKEIESGPDMLISNWLEEIYDEGNGERYITHGPDLTWMHGKVIRKQFLEKNQIRHHRSLRIHEDSYFLSIAAAMAESIRECSCVSYVWRWRAESITRRNKCAYTYDSLPSFIYAQALASKVIENRKPDLMTDRIARHTCLIYYLIHTEDWLKPEHLHHKSASEKAFKQFCGPYLHYLDTASSEQKENAYRAAQASVNGPMLIEGESFYEWITEVRK